MPIPVQGAWLLALPLLLAASALAGCTPSIGDSCATSTNCASDGTRVCDTSEPGGYCTVLNCTGNNLGSVCPDYALCVLFNANEPGCPYSAYSPAPTGESECRNKCNSNSDCRASYLCASPLSAPWNAEILDTEQTAKVCMPALDFVDGGKSWVAYGYDGSPDAIPAVCRAAGPTFDAGFPPLDAGVDAALDVVPPVDGGVPDAPAHDALIDSPADASPDALPDASSDAGPDATVDSGHDATVDSAPEAAPVDAAAADASDAGLPDAAFDAPADAPDGHAIGDAAPDALLDVTGGTG
jgi:hypothetical protein